MAFVRIHRVINNPAAGVTSDYAIGTRGGILLNVGLAWKPRQYFNINVSGEEYQLGDMQVILGDSTGATTILGQDASGVIVVPHLGRWDWVNPMRDQILGAATIIEKLAFQNFTPMPIGVVRGNFRVIASYDPIKQVSHDIVVEAEFLVFDSAIV